MRYNLQRRGRAVQVHERVRLCSTRSAGTYVAVRQGEGGGAHWHGLVRCGSVHECPTCSAVIASERAAEVTRAVESWGRDRVVMLTATVRHGLGHDYAAMVRGVSEAWRYFFSGRPGQRLRAEAGVVHYVRAMETTWGAAHGWHPHLHVLLLLDASLPPARLAELRRALAERWALAVERQLGREHLPTWEHGVVLTPLVGRTDYLAKLGLEITGGAAKAGRGEAGEHLGPWQLLERAADGDRRATALWQSYCHGIHGRRQLTWSRDARAALAVDQRTDEEIVADVPEAPVHYRIHRRWYRSLYERGLAVAALEVAESDWSGELLARWLASMRLPHLPPGEVGLLIGAGDG